MSEQNPLPVPKENEGFKGALEYALAFVSYKEGLNWLTNWEFERATKAREHAGEGEYSTCFVYVITEYNKGRLELYGGYNGVLRIISETEHGRALASMLRDEVVIGDFRKALMGVIEEANPCR